VPVPFVDLPLGATEDRVVGGSSAASARTAVDLPVPRSPNTITPPIRASTAAISSARFISSWPTIAENGKDMRTHNV
jgi:hypothetical protein